MDHTYKAKEKGKRKNQITNIRQSKGTSGMACTNRHLSGSNNVV